MSDQVWYFAEQDQTKGPLSFEELVQVLKRRARADEVLVWCEGNKDWARAGDVHELSRLLVRPPPLPNKRAVSPLSPEYSQTPTQEGTKLGWKGVVASVVGAAIGLGLSKLMGSAFWLPALCIFVVYWGLKKTNAALPVILMLSVLAGQTLWMLVGHFSLLLMNKPSPDFGVFFVDLFVVLALTAWCLKRETVISCFVLFVYQCFGLVTSLIGLEQMSKATEAAAFMHLFLRVVGVCLAVYAGVKTRKRREKEIEVSRAGT